MAYIYGVLEEMSWIMIMQLMVFKGKIGDNSVIL